MSFDFDQVLRDPRAPEMLDDLVSLLGIVVSGVKEFANKYELGTIPELQKADMLLLVLKGAQASLRETASK